MTREATTPSLQQQRSSLAAAMRLYPVAALAARGVLFNRYLDLNVRSASPLLAVAEHATGIDLSELVWRIEPPFGWPVRRLPAGSRDPLRPDAAFDFSPAQMIRRHRIAGVLHRPHGWSAGAVVGLRIVSDTVEITAVAGALAVESFRGIARVRLGTSCSETLASACAGRTIGEVVDHPWLAGAPWPVVEVRTSALGRTCILFETGRAAWRLPWPEGI